MKTIDEMSEFLESLTENQLNKLHFMIEWELNNRYEDKENHLDYIN